MRPYISQLRKKKKQLWITVKRSLFEMKTLQ